MVVLRRRRRHLAASSLLLLLLLLLLLFFFAEASAFWAGSAAAHAAQPTGPFTRSLMGPGSSPPYCRSKCGQCAPCKPVHVPIQPGVSFPLEYYPEAWRCKCGNQLFMP